MTAPRRLAHALVAATLSLGALVPLPARAQAFDATLGPYALRRRFEYHGEVYDQTGTALGAAASVRWGRLSVGAAGWSGTLSAHGGLPNGDVRVRTTAASLHLSVTSAIFVGVRMETRRFAAAAGVTVWQLKGWDVLFHPELGLPGLQGVAEVAVLSSSTVREGPKMDAALQTTMGIAYAAGFAPLLLRLAYRFERYDLSVSGASAQRLEQFGGVVAEVGLRLAVPRARVARR